MHNSANILFMVGSAHDSATSFGDWGYADGAVPCLCTSQCVYFHSYNTRKKKANRMRTKLSHGVYTRCENHFFCSYFLLVQALERMQNIRNWSRMQASQSIKSNWWREEKQMKNCCREALYVGNEFICAGRHMVACVFDVFLFFHIMRQRICPLVNIIRIRECLIKKMCLSICTYCWRC